VVRPTAGDKQIALNINPYHLGFSIWDRLIEAHGIEHARTIMRSEDDFGFVRNQLDANLADELNLFVYDAKRNGEVKVTDNDIHLLHEAILSPKFNFGAPRVSVTEMGVDGALELTHENGTDGRGLDTERAQKVIDYIQRVWRRPVSMRTLDASGKESTLETGKAAA
jgi:stage V sporulation protein R